VSAFGVNVPIECLPGTIESDGDHYRVTKAGQMLSLDKTVTPWRLYWTAVPDGWRVVGELKASPHVATSFAVIDPDGKAQLVYKAQRDTNTIEITVSPTLTGYTGFTGWLEFRYENDSLAQFTSLWSIPKIPADWLAQSVFQIDAESKQQLDRMSAEKHASGTSDK
jgi:hypothetical protein